MPSVDDCPVCASNRGQRRISPGPVIHEGSSWLVEHGYPSSLPGWVVIVLRRHAEALHELTGPEARELGLLLRRVARALREELGCAKEYSVCYGEARGFSHLHVHVIPRAPDLPPGHRGGAVFRYLRDDDEPVAPDAVTAICESLSRRLAEADDGSDQAS